MELKIRTLRADEIEARVQSVTDKGAVLLLYKDARCDMMMLDEIVGPMNWKKEYKRDNRNCVVSIYDDEKKEWISKEDTGTESNTEAEKGLASDSFKRACVNWGIGRELYTSPFIFVPAGNCTITQGRNGKAACYDKFSVLDIGYDDKRRINYLVIANSKTGRVVYSYGQKPQVAPPPVQIKEPTPADKKAEALAAARKALAEAGVPESYIIKKNNVRSLEDFTTGQLNSIASRAGAGILKGYKEYQQQQKQAEPVGPAAPVLKQKKTA